MKNQTKKKKKKKEKQKKKKKKKKKKKGGKAKINSHVNVGTECCTCVYSVSKRNERQAALYIS